MGPIFYSFYHPVPFIMKRESTDMGGQGGEMGEERDRERERERENENENESSPSSMLSAEPSWDSIHDPAIIA